MTLEWDNVARAMEAEAARSRCPDDGIAGLEHRLANARAGRPVLRAARAEHDGHEYVDAALEKGAAGAVVDRRPDGSAVIVAADGWRHARGAAEAGGLGALPMGRPSGGGNGQRRQDHHQGR